MGEKERKEGREREWIAEYSGACAKCIFYPEIITCTKTISHERVILIRPTFHRHHSWQLRSNLSIRIYPNQNWFVSHGPALSSLSNDPLPAGSPGTRIARRVFHSNDRRRSALTDVYYTRPRYFDYRQIGKSAAQLFRNAARRDIVINEKCAGSRSRWGRE